METLLALLVAVCFGASFVYVVTRLWWLTLPMGSLALYVWYANSHAPAIAGALQ